MVTNIGIYTGLLNCKGNEIITGDFVKLKNTHAIGPVMYNKYHKGFGIFYGCWYLDKKPLKPESYGKFIRIPVDQSMKDLIIPLSEEEVCEMRAKGELI